MSNKLNNKSFTNCKSKFQETFESMTYSEVQKFLNINASGMVRTNINDM